LLVPDSAQYALYVRSRGEFRYVVATAVNDPVWQPDLPLLIAGPRMSRALLAGVDVTEEMLDAHHVFPSVDLHKSLAVTIVANLIDAPSANVAGMLRGSDPKLRDEVLVYSAHYDHLGISTPDARGDSIYNGFSDNAAGVAMLLAIAKALRDAPPKRSVLFLFVTGEERGLLGSSYFAAHPLVPKDNILADINLDAGAPAGAPLDWRIAGGTSSTLGAVAARVAASHGWTTQSTTASPNTDYWPFLRIGVPAIFIVPGGNWEGLSTAQREALQRRWDHYHQAADEWSPEFPYRGLQRYAQLALEIGKQVANAPDKPRLVQSGDPAIAH
jgi:Zn-dependent M28 family amino/carboxypeptidase